MSQNFEIRQIPEIEETGLIISKFNGDISQQVKILLEDGSNR